MRRFALRIAEAVAPSGLEQYNWEIRVAVVADAHCDLEFLRSLGFYGGMKEVDELLLVT
jgi:hypothetical protein